MRQKNKRRKIPQKFCYLAYSMYLCPTKNHSCVPLVASERSSSGNRLVAQRRVVLQYAYRGRIRKSEGFQIVTSKIALSPKPPINKDGLRFLPKLRKIPLISATNGKKFPLMILKRKAKER